MPATIEELRNSQHVGPFTETFTLCLSAKLRDELKRRDDTLLELNAKIRRIRDQIADMADARAEGQSPQRRHGTPSLQTELTKLEKQAKEAAAACDEVYEQAKKHEIELTIGTRLNSEWANWCAEHRAREGNRRDEVEFQGICNADDLIEDLATYVREISGKPVAAGDWEFVVANASPGDLKDAAKVVVRMHERTSGDLGKSRTDWLADQRISPVSD